LAYFWSTRPVMGLFATLLCLAGFRLQADLAHYHPWAIALCAVVTFLTCSLAMLWNDYADRYRDACKGKRLAYDNPDKFFRVITGLAVALGFSAAFLRDFSAWAAAITLVMIVLSVYYTRSYTRLGLPLAVVALCSAFPSLYGLVLGPEHPGAGAALFLIVVLIIGAREILKDLEDVELDAGYKATLPLRLGQNNSRLISASLLLLAGATAAVAWYGSSLAWVLLPMAGCALLVWPLARAQAGKLVLDLTILALLSGILFGYLGP